jgi:hypothetical protein
MNNYYFIVKLLFITLFLYFYGCTQKEEPIIYIFNYVTGDQYGESSTSRSMISTKEKPDSLTQKQKDSTYFQSEEYRASLLEKQSINQIKKTIHSRHLDLNFDVVQDFIVFYNIESEVDTVSYFSIYISDKISLFNSFDYKFDDALTKVNSVSTYSDSTIIIKFKYKRSKKIETIKFIYQPPNNYILIN